MSTEKNARIILGLFFLIIVFCVVFNPNKPDRKSEANEVLKVHDRVVVVDKDQQLTHYCFGGMLSDEADIKDCRETPESEKAVNGEEGNVIRIGCRREEKATLYSEGSQKLVSNACSEPTFFVKLDSGKLIEISANGGIRKAEPNFISVNGKVIPNPKKQHQS